MDVQVKTRQDNLPMKNRLHTILLSILVSIVTITFILVAVTLSVVSYQKKKENESIMATTSTSVVIKHLVDTVNSTQLMFHLAQLQTIADQNGGTRSLGSAGFQATVDYIEAQLKSKTDFRVFKEEFMVPTSLKREPMLVSTISGVEKNYKYDIDF
ncbi:unnamed protein product, partial [Adineta ricciae]